MRNVVEQTFNVKKVCTNHADLVRDVWTHATGAGDLSSTDQLVIMEGVRLFKRKRVSDDYEDVALSGLHTGVTYLRLRVWRPVSKVMTVIRRVVVGQ